MSRDSKTLKQNSAESARMKPNFFKREPLLNPMASALILSASLLFVGVSMAQDNAQKTKKEPTQIAQVDRGILDKKFVTVAANLAPNTVPVAMTTATNVPRVDVSGMPSISVSELEGFRKKGYDLDEFTRILIHKHLGEKSWNDQKSADEFNKKRAELITSGDTTYFVLEQKLDVDGNKVNLCHQKVEIPIPGKNWTVEAQVIIGTARLEGESEARKFNELDVTIPENAGGKMITRIFDLGDLTTLYKRTTGKELQTVTMTVAFQNESIVIAVCPTDLQTNQIETGVPIGVFFVKYNKYNAYSADAMYTKSE
jgi:hypothetical protein